MRTVSLLSVTVLNSLVLEAVAHQLCYYDERPPDPDHLMAFCPQQAEGACCNDAEEAAAMEVYATPFPDSGSYPTDECAEYYIQVACGPCHSYSNNLYEVLGEDLGPEDGMTLKYEFCEELMDACEGQIDFPTYGGESYCEKHTLGSTGPATDYYWSYPLPDSPTPSPAGLDYAFPELLSTFLPFDLICMHMTPDGDEWWLGGQYGQIVKIPAQDATESTLVLDLSSGADFYAAYEEGLLDFAFSPAFDSNNYFYVSYTIISDEGLANRLSRFTYSSSVVWTLASIDIVLTSELKPTSLNCAGWVGFKPSDYANPSVRSTGSSHDIYWATGDGGPQTDPLGNGQEADNLLGAIVRVSVPSGTSSIDVGYSIPSDNYPGGREEICAPGFRNPFRCGFDSATDDLYCGDRGYTAIEEVDIVRCGENYGWGRFEGSRCQEAAEDLYGDCDGASRSEFTFPIYEYCDYDYFSSDADEAEFTDGVDICGTRNVTGFIVTGGYVYHGQEYSDVLEGAYIFADVWTGNIYYLAPRDGAWIPGVIVGDGSAHVSSFAQDSSGEIYIISSQALPYHLPCGELCSTTCLDLASPVPTFQSLGCFADDTSNRALQLQESPVCDDGEKAMSPAICASYCATIDGAVYFGVQDSNECFCGAEDEDYAKNGALDDSSCRVLCTGYPNYFCGGYGAIEMYEFDPTPTPTPTSYPAPAPVVSTTPSPQATLSYLGCYGDNNQARVLSGSETTSAQMTPEFCADFCKGSQYFGTQYSNECFCSAAGDEYDKYGTATCNYDCAGDSSMTCGGRNAISIYEYDGFTPAPVAPTSPPIPSSLSTYTSQGCYTDSKADRLLDAASISTVLMSTELCEAFCAGYTFFGTEFGKECFCGSPASLGSDTATNCDMECTGDSSQLCGGFDAINVYEYTGVTSSDYTYMGCYTDSNSNRVMGSMSGSSSMTTDLCASTCASSLYFGTEYSSQCFCSDTDDFDALGISVACTMPCAGDSTKICGGRNAISVYMK